MGFGGTALREGFEGVAGRPSPRRGFLVSLTGARRRTNPDGSMRVSELSRWELDSLFALVQHLTEMLQPGWRREVHASWATNAPFERSVAAALVRDLAALLPLRDQPPGLPPLPAKYHTLPTA